MFYLFTNICNYNKRTPRFINWDMFARVYGGCGGGARSAIYEKRLFGVHVKMVLILSVILLLLQNGCCTTHSYSTLERERERVFRSIARLEFYACMYYVRRGNMMMTLSHASEEENSTQWKLVGKWSVCMCVCDFCLLRRKNDFEREYEIPTGNTGTFWDISSST